VSFTDQEILETVRMIELETLDIRTTTLGINLLDCADPDLESACEKIYTKIVHHAREPGEGRPVDHRRLRHPDRQQAHRGHADLAVAAACGTDDLVPFARAMDAAAKACGVDFIGGFTAYVHKGFTNADRALFESIPRALAETEHVCSSVSLATTRAGINMDAVARFSAGARDRALTADQRRAGLREARVLLQRGRGQPVRRRRAHRHRRAETVVNVGVSGPGVVRSALAKLGPDADLLAVAETIKRTAFKITRMGELVGREAARRSARRSASSTSAWRRRRRSATRSATSSS
jgi:uncharacterized protein (UPF0210 family)